MTSITVVTRLRYVVLVMALVVMIESRTTTTLPLSSTVVHSTTPRRDGCFHEGKWYSPGEEISRGFDGNNWCYGTICDESGVVIHWDNFKCGTTTVTPPTTIRPKTTQTIMEPITTTPPPPPTTMPFTSPNGCFKDGKWYGPGEEMSRGFDGKNWCHGTYCDESGNVVSWDNWECGTTTTPTTPTTTTTPPTPPTTTRSGCFHEGKWYSPGEEISQGYDGRDWCYGTICDESGVVMHWDNFKCGTTTPTPPTTIRPKTTQTTMEPITTTPPPPPPPTTIPFTSPNWCFQDGKWYSPGEEISRVFDGKNWCYGTACDHSGHVVSWDNWECGTTTVPTTHAPTTVPTTHAPTSMPTTHGPTTLPTTRAPTTIPTTHVPTTIPIVPIKTRRKVRPRGCVYRGNRYEPNSIILQSTNGNGWCYGRRCSNDGQVILWDDFSCRPTKSGGCWYGGSKYAYGSELFRIRSQLDCYGGVCGKNGKIKTWTRMSCNKERQFHGGRLKPSWCKYRGDVYPRGSVFAVKSFKRYGFGWCIGAKCVANGRIVTWGPKWAPGYC